MHMAVSSIGLAANSAISGRGCRWSNISAASDSAASAPSTRQPNQRRTSSRCTASGNSATAACGSPSRCWSPGVSPYGRLVTSTRLPAVRQAAAAAARPDRIMARGRQGGELDPWTSGTSSTPSSSTSAEPCSRWSCSRGHVKPPGLRSATQRSNAASNSASDNSWQSGRSGSAVQKSRSRISTGSRRRNEAGYRSANSGSAAISCAGIASLQASQADQRQKVDLPVPGGPEMHSESRSSRSRSSRGLGFSSPDGSPRCRPRRLSIPPPPAVVVVSGT